MKTTLCVAAGAALAISLAAGGAQANLLTNGSFETGDLSGWTETGVLGDTGATPFSAEDGVYRAYSGAVGGDNFLSQTFADTVGQTYLVSGWMYSDGDVINDFNMSIDGVAHVSLVNVPLQGYTEYSFTFLGSGSDTFTVGSRDDPGFLGMDNFTIDAGGAVPEPAAWALMIGGLGMVGAGLRRRRMVVATA